jgi:uncharacterized phage-like protein YoqJ
MNILVIPTHSVAATGNRPEKLVSKEVAYSNEFLEALIGIAQAHLERMNPIDVVTGGALGWDQAVPIAAIRMKIMLLVALPFRGYESNWPQKSQRLLYRVMEKATVEYVTQEGYEAWKMDARNRFMVDHADTILALWNGQRSGTAKTVAYAVRQRRKIVNAWENWIAIKAMYKW